MSDDDDKRHARLSIAVTPDELAMLDAITRHRHAAGERVRSMTIRELIREEYQRIQAQAQQQT